MTKHYALSTTIRLYTPSDQTAWDDFVLNHPQGTFFHLIGWKNVIEKTFGHKSYYLLAQDGPKIVGILPLFVVKSFLFGKSLTSVAFGAYGGVLAQNGQSAQSLLEEAIKITQKENLDYLELRNLFRREPNWPVKDLYYTFRGEIFPNLEDNLKAIPRKSRRMVRVGRDKYKLKSEIAKGNLLNEFYEIYAHSLHNLGTPVFPRALFKNFLQEFNNDCKILLVRNPEGKAIAGVMSFFYKDEVLPYYGGSLPEGKKMAANDFMYWELMKYGCEHGYKIFDFGRSKRGTGSFDFKKHWGFEPRPLYYQYYLHRLKEIPNISPINPKYQKKIEMWKKLPFALTKILGPMIVKYIP